MIAEEEEERIERAVKNGHPHPTKPIMHGGVDLRYLDESELKMKQEYFIRHGDFETADLFKSALRWQSDETMRLFAKYAASKRPAPSKPWGFSDWLVAFTFVLVSLALTCGTLYGAILLGPVAVLLVAAAVLYVWAWVSV